LRAGDHLLDVILGGVTWVEAGLLLLAAAALCIQTEDVATRGLFQRCLHALSPWHHIPLLALPLYGLYGAVTWARGSWNNALHSAVVLARQSGAFMA
jgi:hypothetical protein